MINSIFPDPIPVIETPFYIVFIVSLSIEVIIAAIYIIFTKKPWKILFWVILINFISMPMVWYLFPSIKWGWGLIGNTFIVELLVIVVEAYVIFTANREHISVKSALFLSLIMNIASFAIMPYISHRFIHDTAPFCTNSYCYIYVFLFRPNTRLQSTWPRLSAKMLECGFRNPAKMVTT